jgi:hypothetical protein
MQRQGQLIIGIVIAAFIFWIGWTSPNLNQCLQQAYYNDPGQPLTEYVSRLYGSFVGYRLCIGDFVHANRDDIIAIFIVILGIITWRLWLTTRDLVGEAQTAGEGQLSAASILAAAAKKSADASFQSALAATIERDPVVAIDSVQVSSANVNKWGALITIQIKFRNAGGGAARGFTSNVKFNLAQPDSFNDFIVECREAARETKYVLLKGQSSDETYHFRISRRTYDDWFAQILEPFSENLAVVTRETEELMRLYERNHNDLGDSRLVAEERLKNQERICRNGMPLHVYVVATWIGIEPNTVSYAARKYYAVALLENGHEDGRLVPMADIGPLALSLVAIGGQELGPIPDESWVEQRTT